MNAHEWFGLGLRFYGVYFLAAALAWCRALAEVELGLSQHVIQGEFSGGNNVVEWHVYNAVCQFCLGCCLFFGADSIAKWAYRKSVSPAAGGNRADAAVDE